MALLLWKACKDLRVASEIREEDDVLLGRGLCITIDRYTERNKGWNVGTRQAPRIPFFTDLFHSSAIRTNRVDAQQQFVVVYLVPDITTTSDCVCTTSALTQILTHAIHKKNCLGLIVAQHQLSVCAGCCVNPSPDPYPGQGARLEAACLDDLNTRSETN